LNLRPLRPERGRVLLFAVSLCRRIPPELRFPVVLSWEVPGDGEPFAPSLLRRRAGCQRHPVDLAVPDHGGDGGQHASTTATDHAELAHRPRRDSPPGGRWDGALPPTPATVAAAPCRLSRRPARPARAISSVSRWTRSPMCCRTVLSWPTELGVCAGAPRDVTGTPKPFGPSLLRQTTLGLVRHPVGLATPDRAAARGQPSTPTAVPTSRSSAPGRRVVAPPRGGRRDEAPRHPGGLSIRPRV